MITISAKPAAFLNVSRRSKHYKNKDDLKTGSQKMRRINPYVKEAINAARYDSVRNEEILGAYFESTNHDDKTLNQIHVLIDECRENDKQQLLILLQLEANEVTNHFGVLDKSADAGSAFPWESVDAIPQSLNEYIGRQHIFERLTSLPRRSRTSLKCGWIDSGSTTNPMLDRKAEL